MTDDQYRQQFREASRRIETSATLAEFSRNVRWLLARISFQPEISNPKSAIINPPHEAAT